MNYLGIEASVRNLPELDRDFFPLCKFNHAFLTSAKKPIGIAVERSGGEMASVHTFIHGTPDRIEADRYYVRRLVKSISANVSVRTAARRLTGTISPIYMNGRLRSSIPTRCRRQKIRPGLRAGTLTAAASVLTPAGATVRYPP